ncbi:hypothetical protein HYX02_01740 [Candidatus Woesearchaeota archaeon]|nr:hypothetical protein [Candidatus Woesearchaeota archaeon]
MMKEKKEKKKWGLILFLVFIMLGTTFSFVFFGFSPVTEKAKYNGLIFSFIPRDNIWIAKINGKDAAFSFLPKDADDVLVFDDSFKMLEGRFEIDVTSDANSTFKEAIALAQHQMGLTLAQYNIYVRKGFTANSTFSLPVIICKDATLIVPIVYFNYGNTTNIHVENNCIIAEASSNADFIKVKDRLLYGILGVMN